MKKILFLSTSNINQRSGGALATLAYYNAMKTLYPGQIDLLMPAEFCLGNHSNAIKVPRRTTLEAVLSGSIHRYKSFISSYLKNNRDSYDLCFINGGIYAGDMIDIIHNYGCKIVVLHHNFEREYQMDNKTLWTLKGLTPVLVMRNERKAYLNADCNLFLTNEDKEMFAFTYGEKRLSSHITGSFEPYNEDVLTYANERNPIIAITGSMNTLQTISGISDINLNYYDILSTICPEWDLLIAGRNPGDVIYKFERRNPNHITVIPNPENMNDVLKSVSIYLCPTNVGGGLKLRVMDGLKAGLPILVHKVSSRGYGYYFNKPYFKVYNDKTSFENGLRELVKYCQKDFNRESIQRDYKDYFGFDKGCERLKRALESLK